MDTFLTLLRLLLVPFFLYISLNLSCNLDFSNKSPCLYAKLKIRFFLHSILFSRFLTNIVLSLQFLTSSRLTFNHTINQLFEKLLFNLIVSFSSIFPSSLALMLRSYEEKISTLASILYYIDHTWRYIKSN